MSRFLGVLDDLRDRYGPIFRLLCHYRKLQGGKRGRGSTEIAGSGVLGAWVEDSLFFERTGRAFGEPTQVAMQSKDLEPYPDFLLRLHTDGPKHDPTLIRLTVEDAADVPAHGAGGRPRKADSIRATILEAWPTLPRTEPDKGGTGRAGVTMEAILCISGASDKPTRDAVKALVTAKELAEVGRLASQAKLYDLPNDQAVAK